MRSDWRYLPAPGAARFRKRAGINSICQRWCGASQHRPRNQNASTIPLSPPVAELLTRMRAAAPADAVFLFPSPNRPGQPRGDLSHVWPRVAKAANIESARLHDLRHTAASALSIFGRLPANGRRVAGPFELADDASLRPSAFRSAKTGCRARRRVLNRSHERPKCRK